MFPFFSTTVGILLCLTGLDLKGEGVIPGLNAWSWLPLLILIVGEPLVHIARKKRPVLSQKTVRLVNLVFSLYPVTAFISAVFALGWPYLPEALGIESWFFVDKALLLASYLALSNLTRWYRIRFFNAFDPRPLSSTLKGLEIAFRGEMTLVVPFGIFILFSDLISLNEQVRTWFDHLPLLLWGGLLLLFLATAYGMPGLIRRIWNLKPLPSSSPVRGALFRFMDSQGFQARDILLWPTGGNLFNAAIVGLTKRTRFILFTDSMLEALSVPELKAVLAHELGHGKNLHLPIYLMFSTAFIFGLSLAQNLLIPYQILEIHSEYVLIGIGVLVLLYWWIVFGLLSRRFEMEADIFGASAVGNPGLFIATLDRIGRIGRVSRKRSSWRHFSIDRRIASLRKVFFDDPGIAVRFWLKMRWLRRLLTGASLAVFLSFALAVLVDTLAGMGTLAVEEGRFERGEDYLKTAISLPFGSPHQWSLLDLYQKSGRLDQADAVLETLSRDETPGPASTRLKAHYLSLGIAALLQGEPLLFDRIVTRSLSLFPGDPDLRTLKKLSENYERGDPMPLKRWLSKIIGPPEKRSPEPTKDLFP